MPCYKSGDLVPEFHTAGKGSYATEAECLEACKEGACCNGTTCSVKPQCQCNAEAGEVFNGVGTTCPCTFNTSMLLTIAELSDPAGGIGTSPLALGVFNLLPVHDGCIFREYRYLNARPPKTFTSSDGSFARVVPMDVQFRIFQFRGEWRVSMLAPSRIDEETDAGVVSPDLDYYLTNCAVGNGQSTVGFGDSLEAFGRGPFSLCAPYSISLSTGTNLRAACFSSYPYHAYSYSIEPVLNPLP